MGAAARHLPVGVLPPRLTPNSAPGFRGSAGCSQNPAASATLPEHGAQRCLLLHCRARSKQQNSLGTKRVPTGPLSPAMWLLRLASAKQAHHWVGLFFCFFF